MTQMMSGNSKTSYLYNSSSYLMTRLEEEAKKEVQKHGHNDGVPHIDQTYKALLQKLAIEHGTPICHRPRKNTAEL
jgi:hypothetical protein